jgi:hypothetical protein
MSETFKPTRHKPLRRNGLSLPRKDKPMRRLPLLLLTLAAPVAAGAQPAPSGTHAQPAQAAIPGTASRMAPFRWLVGEWRGSGWTLLPDGSRHTFDSRESVSVKLSGHALLIEGKHYLSGQPERIVHDAMGMLHWDNRTNGFRFRTALASGMAGDFPVEPTANGFNWRIDTPGGRIDYTITHEGGEWVERGRRTGADGQAVDFFEMRLRKQ